MTACLPGTRNSTWLFRAVSVAPFSQLDPGLRGVGLSPLSAPQSLALKKYSIRVCVVSICCLPGKTASGSCGCWGCPGVGAARCGGPRRPGPGDWAWLPCPPGACPFIPAAQAAAFGRKAGPCDVCVISCFLYGHVGPQNSKCTFKNEQAINGNNIHDIQSGRQEVND